MRVESEYDYSVLVLPRPLVTIARPFFRHSMPHRGRIWRFSRMPRGPVLRDPYGLW